MSPEELIRTQYPYLAFLLNDPEIGPLLLQAVDPNTGFDAATFQAKLYATNWWKTHSDAARQWLVLQATDPATAQAKRDELEAQMRDMAGQFGVPLSDDQYRFLVELALQNGQSINSEAIRDGILSLAQFSEEMPTGGLGSIGSLEMQIKDLANKKYLVGVSDQDAFTWATQILSGQKTLEGITADLAHVAAQRFPSLAQQIAAGSTPGDIIAPVVNLVAQQLEISPDKIDLMNDPRWSKILSVADPATGLRPMTYSEALSFARSQPEWANTLNGKAAGADLTSTIVQTFGEVKQ